MIPEASPLRLGLLGCGRIAATHLDAVERVPECRLVAVADVDEAAARRAAAGRGVPAHGDPRRLIEADAVDAVIVCTPPASHAALAGACLDAGLHVLCEKPLALTSEEARELVARARAAERLLMMASKFRYVDDVIKARGLVDSGVLGEIVLYENVFCSRVDMRGRWNARPEAAGGGVLIDNGTHSVDVARFFLGPIAEVRAEEGLRVQELEVEDTCRLHLRSASGAMGAVDLSWSIHKEREAYIELFGAEGVISIGWGGSRYRQSRDHEWVAFGDGYDKVAAFARQLRNFAGSIRGAEAPQITSEDALESVRVIETAYRSMQADRWLRVR